MVMDIENSIIRLPSLNIADGTTPTPDDIKEAICFSKILDEKFIAADQEEPSLENQKYGSWNGVMRLFPSRAQGWQNEKTKYPCGEYEPRIRNWFVAAAAGPKDIVIVVDRSGSMGEEISYDGTTRWDLVISAVRMILKTLTNVDYANVVLFAGEAEVLWGGDRLYQATSETVSDMRDEIKTKGSGGTMSFQAGFEKAFDLLDNSAEYTSNCQKAILFLTDGVDTSGYTEQEILDLIEVRNQAHNAVIFTYSMGMNSDDQVPKSIACANKGIWQSVKDDELILSQMSGYYTYFSLGYAREEPRTAWCEPYGFGTDGTLGTSVATPVYSHMYDPPVFIGVVSVGVSLKVLTDIQLDADKIIDNLIGRSSQCPAMNISECELEALRANYDQGSICGTVSCGDLVEVVPPSCSSTVHPDDNDLWRNLDAMGQTLGERSCCNGCWINASNPDPEPEPSSTDKNTVAIIVLSVLCGAIGIVLVVVAIIVGMWCIIPVYRAKNKTETKGEIELKPPNRDMPSAPAYNPDTIK